MCNVTQWIFEAAGEHNNERTGGKKEVHHLRKKHHPLP